MTQVMVKTSAGMRGSYTYDVAPDQVAEFVDRYDVWWYIIVDDEDWEWRKGGAWKPRPGFVGPEAAGARISRLVELYGVKAGELPAPPMEGKREPKESNEPEDDDGRW